MSKREINSANEFIDQLTDVLNDDNQTQKLLQQLRTTRENALRTAKHSLVLFNKGDIPIQVHGYKIESDTLNSGDSISVPLETLKEQKKQAQPFVNSGIYLSHIINVVISNEKDEEALVKVDIAAFYSLNTPRVNFILETGDNDSVHEVKGVNASEILEVFIPSKSYARILGTGYSMFTSSIELET